MESLTNLMPKNHERKYEQFKLVFEEYYSMLCNYAHTYIRDRDSCEDIVQEVFLRIWEKRADLIGVESLRFYLFTAVRNNCLSHLLHEKKSRIIREEIRETTAEIFSREGMDDPPIDRQSFIQDAISMLPPKCKDVFLLSRIGNLSYKEIAKTKGISVKTVENQIGKALKIMRAFLKKNKLFAVAWTMGCFQLAGNHFIGDCLKLLFY